MLCGFGEILQNVNPNRSHYDHLVEDQYESVELLRVWSLNDVVEQEK